jgi:hypothetical protein
VLKENILQSEGGPQMTKNECIRFMSTLNWFYHGVYYDTKYYHAMTGGSRSGEMKTIHII